jgi:hypothetical protein
VAVERTAAADIVSRRTEAAAPAASAERTAVAAVEVAKPESAEGLRNRFQYNRAVVAAREPTAARAVVLPRRKPPLPSPVRRKMGTLFLREEHRVRIADKSS